MIKMRNEITPSAVAIALSATGRSTRVLDPTSASAMPANAVKIRKNSTQSWNALNASIPDAFGNPNQAKSSMIRISASPLIPATA